MCVRFPNWPVQRLRSESGAEVSAVALHTPQVVFEPASGKQKSIHQSDLRFIRAHFPSARSGPAVIAVSQEAWSAGIRPGMPLAEARSMAQPSTRSSHERPGMTQFAEWSPLIDREALLKTAEHLRSFAPVVALDDLPVPDCLLLDISGCAPLFGGESALAEHAVRRLRETGFYARIAISDSIATAWAFSHADGNIQTDSGPSRRRPMAAGEQWDLPIIIIPPGQSATYLQELPVSAARLQLADLEILGQLGIHSIRQLFLLPVEDLPSRLTDNAVLRIRQLQGVESELMTPLPEANPVRATWSAEFPATNRNEIRQILDYLVNRIVEQLIVRNLGTTRLDCELTQEDKSTLHLRASVIRPVQCATLLMDVITLRMEAMAFRKPVTAVSMHAAIAPMPVARQRDLFSATEHLEPQDELAALVNRLGGRLGHHAVKTVLRVDDARPEQAVRHHAMLAGDTGPSHGLEDRLQDLVNPEVPVTEEFMNRPIHLLQSPMVIAKAPTDPLRDGFVWQGKHRNTIRISGPERIETAWWEESSMHRDYYRIETTCGSRLWIFSDLGSRDWFLHGVFD